MKNIYIWILMIGCFLFGFYYVDIKLMTEKQFNQTRICNKTKHDIEKIEFQTYKNLYSWFWFQDIPSWTCTEYIKTPRLDNKMKEIVRFMSGWILHEYRDGPLDPVSFHHKKIWKNTINIVSLYKDGRKTTWWWIIGISYEDDE